MRQKYSEILALKNNQNFFDTAYSRIIHFNGYFRHSLFAQSQINPNNTCKALLPQKVPFSTSLVFP